MEEKIIRIMSEVLPDADVENSEDFFEDGLDSMGVMTIVSMFYSELNIDINPEDITADNFGDMQSLVALAKKYQ